MNLLIGLSNIECLSWCCPGLGPLACCSWLSVIQPNVYQFHAC